MFNHFHNVLRRERGTKANEIEREELVLFNVMGDSVKDCMLRDLTHARRERDRSERAEPERLTRLGNEDDRGRSPLLRHLPRLPNPVDLVS